MISCYYEHGTKKEMYVVVVIYYYMGDAIMSHTQKGTPVMPLKFFLLCFQIVMLYHFNNNIILVMQFLKSVTLSSGSLSHFLKTIMT